MAINTTQGWELTDSGREHLRSIGVSAISSAAANVAHDLRSELAKIKDDNTRRFLEEAIKCFEHGFYRSAVIMSWVGAVHVLHAHVHAKYLAAFNAEAARVDVKWKAAKTTDDLGRMKERDFLDRLGALSIIGPNVKTALINCLNLRNGCGHPNSMKIGPNAVASHLETLLLNVFRVF
jgi:hypothetical protein